METNNGIMHDNTYVFAKNPRRVVDLVVEITSQCAKEQKGDMKEWSVRFYSNGGEDPMIPTYALLVKIGEESKTCISLHAFGPFDEESFDMPKYDRGIVITPHYWTDYANRNQCPNQELENLLNSFDKVFVKTFSFCYSDIQYK